MRTNLPVTHREYPFPDDVTLLSTTDVDSRITYANAPFVQMSGFSVEELLGQPHNIVRHPDMPVEAFADMWRTLKSGRSWTGLVKNRRKDGDHYWVRANVTPMTSGGRVVGYLSVRTKPLPGEAAAADALYRRLREKTVGNLALHSGLVVRRGLARPLSWMQLMSTRARLLLGAATGTLIAGAGVAAAAVMAGMAALPLAIAVGAVAVGMALTMLFNDRQVAVPLRVILVQAQTVASGQTGASPGFDRVDEIGLLMRAVSQCGLNLRALVDDVRGQVSGVETASSEIAAGTADLSVRTEEAASSLEQTAAAMDQMASAVRQTAESAREASRMAVSATQAASRGGETVGRVVKTMSEIEASSKRISSILGVIDGIAFQTNILALNAAVEAARAGDQGRGFAVVAGEVRKLAQRSAEEATAIRALIDDSVRNVETGSAQIADVVGKISDVVSQVSQVSNLIGEITTAADEQTAGIGQVNIAVAQLDQMTQQNAALVEQSSAASESLKDQARRLGRAVAVFA